MIHRVTAAVEGLVDEAVVSVLCREVRVELGPVYGKQGKNYIDRKLRGFNNAAKYADWLVLRDMNHDASCAPELKTRLLPQPATNMKFRIAVREVEAWLLADRKRFARYLSVPQSSLPTAPESLDSPKQEVVRLASMSRRRAIREDMMPSPGSGTREGPAYASRLVEFVYEQWDPFEAAKRSDSLSRCIRSLGELS